MKLPNGVSYRNGRIIVDVKNEGEEAVIPEAKEKEEVCRDLRNRRYLFVSGLVFTAFALGYIRGVRAMVKGLYIIR